MRRQGKKAEADEISRNLIERCAGLSVPSERAEAVRALLSLSGDPAGADWTRVFGMIEELLKNDSANPEYRFQYAVMLGRNLELFRNQKNPGVEPNAVILLNDLAQKHPDRPEYGLALMELMNRRLRYAGSFRRWRMRCSLPQDFLRAE